MADKFRKIEGKRTHVTKRRRTGGTRRVIFVPKEGGAEFVVIDADSYLPLTIRAAVVTTVEDDLVYPADLGQ